MLGRSGFTRQPLHFCTVRPGESGGSSYLLVQDHDLSGSACAVRPLPVGKETDPTKSVCTLRRVQKKRFNRRKNKKFLQIDMTPLPGSLQRTLLLPDDSIKHHSTIICLVSTKALLKSGVVAFLFASKCNIISTLRLFSCWFTFNFS